MMMPMQRDHGHESCGAQRDQAIGGFNRQLVLHDQRGETGDQQQGRQAPQAMRPVMVMKMVMAMMAAVVMTSAMSPAPAVRHGAFIEREFIAHADIKFAHRSPCCCAASWTAQENIITQSSKVNHCHQKIIISIKVLFLLVFSAKTESQLNGPGATFRLL
jgi:hypothetical protein